MANIIASGDYWRLEDDGTLYIYCVGDMPNYTSSAAPWYDYHAQITSASIANGVTSIGDYAFDNCSGLTSITIPQGVTSIGKDAFFYCSGLTSITIPSSVTNIESSAFNGCSGLTSITIPSGVTSIKSNTFHNCRGLTSITIPDGVTSIGDDAFSNCRGLTSITIPDGVTSIGNNAFHTCSALTSVTIPGSVTSIGNHAFHNCSGLTRVTIPQGVTSIGEFTFYNCSGLTSITIPSGVTSIGKGVFRNCSGLTSVTIPGSVTSIEDGAFSNCSGLTDVYYGGTEAQWDAITIDSNNTPLTSATIHYNYAPVTLSSIAVTTPPTKTAYTVGETFDPSGMAVTATYSDGTTATVSGYGFSPSGALTLADTIITIRYTEGNITETAPVPVTVTAGNRASIPIRLQIIKPNGSALVFQSGAVKQVEYALSTSLDGKDVNADQFTAVFEDFASDWLSRWNTINQSCPVWLSVGTKTEKYYFKSLTRIGKRYFELTAQSPLGRLNDEFPGDLYHAVPLPDVIADVIGNVIPYTVNPLLESVSVYGWLPYQDRRTSLHQLALAYGFIIRRDNYHNLYFTIPETAAYSLPDNAIYNGGSVTYRFGETYARADITAYEFRENDTEAKTLFDNVDDIPADNFIVKFDSPVFNLQADDTLTVHYFGVNFAKVSGSGRLTGKPYTKIASVVSVDGDANADPQHVLSVADVPLITSLNAVTVGERLLSYYNAPAVVNADIVCTNQRPGDCVSFVDPFGDPRTGYITELSGTVSSVERASAALVCGYTPSWGAAYDSVKVLTGSGVWTVPASLDGSTVRVVLIGGGTGGSSGQYGTGLEWVEASSSYEVAVGSGRGLPGSGGNVLDVKFTAVGGQTFQYSAGTGGAGGLATPDTTSGRPENMTVYVTRSGDRWHMNPHCNGGTYTPTTLKQALLKHLTPCENCVKDNALYYVSNPGQPGTASTFGDYSSDDGYPASNGFYDVLYGILYAAPGADNGVDGGSATTGKENGERTNPAYTDVVRPTVTLPWDTSQSWTSGENGEGWHESEGSVYDWAYGGTGGGAAVGNHGGWGGPGYFSAYVRGGGGGDGAHAEFMFPDNITYGSGGSGGHGGGEGGKGGTATAQSGYQAEPGADGYGGAGSNGQNGADGCILVYYKKPDELQYSFAVRDGQLILTYYTETPPPFSVNSAGQLLYSYADGETPPTFEIRNGILYKIE
ncbi:MAG: leucine-rich repeat protein [Oscillibacter sp.]|nr:leucine-rich repeat protein [Oscillibacter sp.]